MNDQENYIRLVNASREGNLQAIKDDDKLDVDMIYNLVLNSYKDNYDANDDDEMVKIDNILELKDNLFDLDGNIVE